MNMAKFFVAAGDYVGHTIRSEGESPRIKFISCFTYTNGYAEFDGSNWTFKVGV